MDEKLREAVGRAIYEQDARQLDALDIGTVLSWEEALEDTREHYRLGGEKAVQAYKKWVDDNADGYLKVAGVDVRWNV